MRALRNNLGLFKSMLGKEWQEKRGFTQAPNCGRCRRLLWNRRRTTKQTLLALGLTCSNSHGHQNQRIQVSPRTALSIASSTSPLQGEIRRDSATEQKCRIACADRPSNCPTLEAQGQEEMRDHGGPGEGRGCCPVFLSPRPTYKEVGESSGLLFLPVTFLAARCRKFCSLNSFPSLVSWEKRDNTEVFFAASNAIFSELKNPVPVRGKARRSLLTQRFELTSLRVYLCFGEHSDVNLAVNR